MLSFFPYARINQVPVDLVFDTVRYVIHRWGFIGTLRVDNGAPFGEPTRQSLSPLHLRLCASGIRLMLNPPRSPQKNAKVERSQGTTARWADPKQCSDYWALQLKLNEDVIIQREKFPSRVCKNKTRMETFPELYQNSKRLDPVFFDLDMVYRLLAKGRWKRKISAQGVVSMFAQDYQVGFSFRGKETWVTFDPLTLEWVFMDNNRKTLNRYLARNLDQKHILALSFISMNLGEP